MYRMITGEVPPGAMDRLHEDTLKEFKELGCKVSTKTAYALLDKGMAIRVQDRYQSMDELMEGLYGADHGRIRRKKKLTEKQKRLYIGVERRPEGFALFCSSGEFCRRPCRAEDSFRQRERP